MNSNELNLPVKPNVMIVNILRTALLSIQQCDRMVYFQVVLSQTL